MTPIVIVSIVVGVVAMLYGLEYIGHRWGARIEPLIDIWWAFPLLGVGTFVTAGVIFVVVGDATFNLLSLLFFGVVQL
jgi:hypothetical protein